MLVIQTALDWLQISGMFEILYFLSKLDNNDHIDDDFISHHTV